MFPTLPDWAFKLFIVAGIAAVLAAFVQPTGYYEQWQDARAEKDKQAAILQIERQYLADLEEKIRSRGPTDEDEEFLMRRNKELQIQAAELDWLGAREKNLKGRWKKANLWIRGRHRRAAGNRFGDNDLVAPRCFEQRSSLAGPVFIASRIPTNRYRTRRSAAGRALTETAKGSKPDIRFSRISPIWVMWLPASCL